MPADVKESKSNPTALLAPLKPLVPKPESKSNTTALPPPPKPVVPKPESKSNTTALPPPPKPLVPKPNDVPLPSNNITSASASDSKVISAEPELSKNPKPESVGFFRKCGQGLFRTLPHAINGGCVAVYLGNYTGAIECENDVRSLGWAIHGAFYFPLAKSILCSILPLIGLNFPVLITGLCGAAFGYYYGSFGKHPARWQGLMLFGCISALTEFIILHF